MNPEDFLIFAEELSMESGEAELRTAISRAYYALFHRAREIVESCGVICPRSASAHEKIPFCLLNSQHDELKATSQKVLNFRALRNKADYSLDDRRWAIKPFVGPYIALGRSLFLDLSELSGRVGEFESGVRDYAANILRFPTRS